MRNKILNKNKFTILKLKINKRLNLYDFKQNHFINKTS